MKLEDAIMVVVSRIDGAAPFDEANYQWRLLAVEMAIRFIYAHGFKIVEEDESRPISIQN